LSNFQSSSPRVCSSSPGDITKHLRQKEKLDRQTPLSAASTVSPFSFLDRHVLATLFSINSTENRGHYFTPYQSCPDVDSCECHHFPPCINEAQGLSFDSPQRGSADLHFLLLFGSAPGLAKSSSLLLIGFLPHLSPHPLFLLPFLHFILFAKQSIHNAPEDVGLFIKLGEYPYLSPFFKVTRNCR